MSFNNHDEKDPIGKRYGQNKKELTKNYSPYTEEIENLIKDKDFGLPMHDSFIKETYEEKKERFSKTEYFLTNLISETNNDKLMHTFLRWQNLRNQLNQDYVNFIQEKLNLSNPTP